MYTIDDREMLQGPKIPNAFKKLGMEFQVKRIEVGDVLYENAEKGVSICFERKTLTDLIGSIHKGRIFKQLDQMQNSYTHSYLVVVGNWKSYYFKKKKLGVVLGPSDANHRLGFFAHVLVRRPTKMIQVENDTQFAKIVQLVCEKSTDGKLVGSGLYVKKMTLEDSYLNMLCCIPGIGEEKAIKIKEKFPRLIELQIGLQNDKFQVDGIGEVLTKNLVACLL